MTRTATWRRKYQRTARHPGACTICHDPVRVGTLIAWAPNTDADHWDCYADLTSSDPARALVAPRPRSDEKRSTAPAPRGPVMEVHDLITGIVTYEPIERSAPSTNRLNPRRRKAAKTYSKRGAGPVRTSAPADLEAFLETKLSQI